MFAQKHGRAQFHAVVVPGEISNDRLTALSASLYRDRSEVSRALRQRLVANRYRFENLSDSRLPAGAPSDALVCVRRRRLGLLLLPGENCGDERNEKYG